MNFPIVSDRECFFVGDGYDRLDENGTIFLSLRSCDSVIPLF